MEQLPVVTDAPMQAPMSAWAYPILNPTLKFLLRTPLHGIRIFQLMWASLRVCRQYHMAGRPAASRVLT
jgi:hypothetical protein